MKIKRLKYVTLIQICREYALDYDLAFDTLMESKYNDALGSPECITFISFYEFMQLGAVLFPDKYSKQKPNESMHAYELAIENNTWILI